MRSKPTTVRIPSTLQESVDSRVKEAGYKSLGEYALGLIRYDLLTRKPHDTTANLSKLARMEQDAVDVYIAKMFETGETLGGSWFHHTLEDAVKAAGTEAPEPHKIVSELLKRLAEKR